MNPDQSKEREFEGKGADPFESFRLIGSSTVIFPVKAVARDVKLSRFLSVM
jgi:hypothetical protein